jgi:hypothetical protein
MEIFAAMLGKFREDVDFLCVPSNDIAGRDDHRSIGDEDLRGIRRMTTILSNGSESFLRLHRVGSCRTQGGEE